MLTLRSSLLQDRRGQHGAARRTVIGDGVCGGAGHKAPAGTMSLCPSGLRWPHWASSAAMEPGEGTVATSVSSLSSCLSRPGGQV